MRYDVLSISMAPIFQYQLKKHPAMYEVLNRDFT